MEYAQGRMTEFEFAAATVAVEDPDLEADEMDRRLGWSEPIPALGAPVPTVGQRLQAAAPRNEPPDAEKAKTLAADMMRAAVRETIDATRGNPFLVTAVFGRLGGLTLKEIGDLSACTQQAVDKHLKEIGKRHPNMERELRKKWRYQAVMHPMGAVLARLGVIDRPVHRRRRPRMQCLPPVFPQFADLFAG